MTSFQLPSPYEGWSEERLKERCHSLSRAYSKYQQIILVLVDQGIDALPPEWREEVESLKRAYSDDVDDLPEPPRDSRAEPGQSRRLKPHK